MYHRIVFAFLFACTALCGQVARAQADDPAGLYLDAYQRSQRGEELERQNRLPQALQSLQEAAQLLNSIAGRYPDWNPSIRQMRTQKVGEGINRLQKRVSSGGTPGGTATASAPPAGSSAGLTDDAPELPIQGGGLDMGGGPEVFNPPVAGRGRAPGGRPAPGGGEIDPIEKVKQDMNRLKSELEESEQKLADEKANAAKVRQALEESTKAARASEERGKILQQRAEVTENALREERAKSTQNAERVAVLQTEARNFRRELDELRTQNEAREEVERIRRTSTAKAYQSLAALKEEKKASDAAAGGAQAAVAREKERADQAIAEAQKKSDAAVQAAQKRVEEISKQRDELSSRLTAALKERDEARGELTKLREAQKSVDKLVTDNTHLMAQLTAAETQIRQFRADGEQKDLKIASLTKEVKAVTQQLEETKKQSATYLAQMKELQDKLDVSGQELAKAKTAGAASAAEKKKMEEENSILKGIVLRQMKDDVRRGLTSKLVLDQVSKMQIKSKELLSQINFLGQPVVNLTREERRLFKTPQVAIGDANEISMAAQPAEAATTVQAPAPVEVPTAGPEASTPGAPEKTKEATAAAAPGRTEAPRVTNVSLTTPPLEGTKSPLSLELPAGEGLAPISNATAGGGTTPAAEAPLVSTPTDSVANESVKVGPGMPRELMPLVQQAKDEFDKGQYREAEKTYDRILAKAPTNLYALSNRGVVLYRSGKLKLAEEAFKKAIVIAPEDGFSHCTLGIVYYVQSKYDDAVNSLTKALAINPKNATAHNYLGITASQKGWQDAAQKELETATALDGNYADAWFNLAVVFATRQPADKENARRCYKKAVQLGAEADQALEGILK